MTLYVDVAVIVGLFILFGLSHSFLASLKFKNFLSKKFGKGILLYRFFYNVFSIISFTAIYFLSPKPGVAVYSLEEPYSYLARGIQGLSVVGILWSLFYFNGKEFLGISQIQRYLKNDYVTSELDEKYSLSVNGPFKYSRHPIYFFSIVFLFANPVMSLFYFTSVICIAIYFYVGSIFEEKKLLKIFGEQYAEYKRKTPRIFPLKFIK